ncbi:MAG: molecular chaperone DnaJ [Luteitalea sp.]|nr:molecular chaperone DnaJ [Luteitalea sp.]
MDFYILLGVERGATPGDIKRAYKRLARRCHPDINPGDRTAVQQFRQIAEAYETLSDPDRRLRYDSGGTSTEGAGPETFGFEGFDFSMSVNGASAPTFGDLFADVLSQREPHRSDQGADLHYTLTLAFEDAMRGLDRELVVTRHERCKECGGSGRLRVPEKDCLQCQGSGILKSARGHMVFSKPCPHCHGTGRHAHNRCPACGGQQLQARSEPLVIRVPAGLADGSRIRVPEKGHAGRNGGPNGDLLITVRVEAHSLFHREGDDLHIVVPIAVHEAALGARVEVPAIDGTARLRVPPGTQSGQRFRLRQRGAPSARDGRRGDLVVEVKLALPQLLDERSKELLREFGNINAADDVRKELTPTR